ATVTSHACRAGGAAAVGFGEGALAQADGVGGDFDQLVVFDEFESQLQGQQARGSEHHGLVGAGGGRRGDLVSFFSRATFTSMSLSRVAAATSPTIWPT